MVVVFFWLAFKASLLSTSGVGNLPSLHQDLHALGWATDADFAHAIAIGQLAPGPTGLWTVALGYLVAGPLGAVAAAIAITLPPLLVLAVDRLYRRRGAHPAVAGFVRGLTLVVSSVIPVVLVKVLAGYGLDIRALGIGSATVGLALLGRVPPGLILAAAAAAGVLLYR